MTLLTEETLGLVKETLNKANKNSDLDWLEIKDKYNFEHSGEHLRKFGSAFKWLEDNGVINLSNIDLKDYKTPNYKETTELTGNGQQKSDRLIEMSEENKKDEEYILQAHGYDPNEWSIVNAKHSIYNVNAKGGITKTLYSSKITVKPKTDGINIDKLVDRLKNTVQISNLSYQEKQGENMLVIPFFDMHFGIANLQTYLPVLKKTIHRIQSKNWDKILIIFGQDALHNDGFTSQTTSGTIIDKVDMEQAWSDLHQFYTIIFDESIKNANSVDAIFSNGNHDQAMGWAFGKLLEHQYPQVKFDSQMKQFKGYIWNNIFLGATHGDKGSNRIFEVYLAEYGKLISKATTKEILSGHIHHQKTIDKYGLVHKTLGTGVPSDEYHQSNGFVGAQKQFQLLEYNKDYPEAVYYI